MSEIKKGDNVAYSRAWLRSTGNMTGALPFARGTVTHLHDYRDHSAWKGRSKKLATIKWDGNAPLPKKVLAVNLVRVDRIPFEAMNPRKRQYRPALSRATIDSLSDARAIDMARARGWRVNFGMELHGQAQGARRYLKTINGHVGNTIGARASNPRRKYTRKKKSSRRKPVRRNHLKYARKTRRNHSTGWTDADDRKNWYAIKKDGTQQWWGSQSLDPRAPFKHGWGWTANRTRYASKAEAAKEAKQIGGHVYQVYPYFEPRKVLV